MKAKYVHIIDDRHYHKEEMTMKTKYVHIIDDRHYHKEEMDHES